MQVKKCIALLLFTMCIKDARRILSWYMSGYTNISCKRDVLCISVDRGFRSKTKMMVEKWLNFTEKNRDKFHFVHCFFFWRCGPRRAMASSFTWFLDHAQSRTITHIHAQSRTTFGRIPLEAWSTRRRDLYLTTYLYNGHKRETTMLLAVFEPTISAGMRP